MKSVRVTKDFRVTIPTEVRKRMKLRPGQKLRVLAHKNRIELLPVEPFENLRGFLKGIDARIERENDGM